MDKELFEKAQNIISQRRSNAIAENERRIQKINKEIPPIKEINDTLFNTGRQLIQLVLSSKGAEVTEKIERIKQDNLEAQAFASQLLVSHGYPADYLNTPFSCPVCSDTGYVKTRYCDCLKQVYNKLMAEKLNKDTQLQLSTFESFSLRYYTGDDLSAMAKIYKYTSEYARNFTLSSHSLLMFGNTGLGKTHLSLAIAGEVIKKGYSVLYDSSVNILRNIEREHFSREHSSDMIDLVMDTDLLILDDLGTEFDSPFYNSTVYNIINTRLNRRRPTIISTNMDFLKIKKRYDERVASRLTTMYDCLEFHGEDVRLQKVMIRKNIPDDTSIEPYKIQP